MQKAPNTGYVFNNEDEEQTAPKMPGLSVNRKKVANINPHAP